MDLRFKCGSEFCRFIIDRENRTLHGISSETNYEKKRLPWSGLFDPDKEEQQDKAMQGLNDYEFKAAITIEMLNKGYELIENGG